LDIERAEEALKQKDKHIAALKQEIDQLTKKGSKKAEAKPAANQKNQATAQRKSPAAPKLEEQKQANINFDANAQGNDF